ncbi:hypothetical protein COO91_05182 [Nostoc flagelliforme CCNUN1]|uniref:Uncharacterized protein n=1 Tax=Nostoc flagelliforme CCNUN1 TaxID=2038116 RepID=A0A2K8SV15_9NOSO|nr:hypothetical protein COO91_05182 [Nostoc flagelliforme CCNUN1]
MERISLISTLLLFVNKIRQSSEVPKTTFTVTHQHYWIRIMQD